MHELKAGGPRPLGSQTQSQCPGGLPGVAASSLRAMGTGPLLWGPCMAGRGAALQDPPAARVSVSGKDQQGCTFPGSSHRCGGWDRGPASCPHPDPWTPWTGGLPWQRDSADGVKGGEMIADCPGGPRPREAEGPWLWEGQRWCNSGSAERRQVMGPLSQGCGASRSWKSSCTASRGTDHADP